MYLLLEKFWGICLLKLSPQDLPASWFLLQLTISFNFITSLVLLLIDSNLLSSIAQALLDITLFLGLLFLLLQHNQKSMRFAQTATAITACGGLINIFAMPIFILLQATASDQINALALLGFLILFIWSLIIIAHILRHALDCQFFEGMILSVAYVLIHLLLSSLLFPAPTS